MNFVFISPNFPAAYSRFCAALKRNGVNVLGIGDAPWEDITQELKEALTEYYRVDTFKDYDAMVRAMGHFTAKYGKIDWVESNNEYWMELDAALRTDFNVTTGPKTDEIGHFRSKSVMKAFYEKAGIPMARYHMVSDLESAKAFIKEVGYPVVVKPDRGVGALATFRLENERDVVDFYRRVPAIPYIMEEYITGEVTTFDGVADSRGDVLFAASHVTKNSIMDMVNEGVPTFYYVNKEVPPEVRDAGERTLKAFGVKSRFFHLEFFRLTKAKRGLGKVGDIVALEVNMRPAGGFTPDMLNFSQSADVYQIWADMVAFDECRHDYDGLKYFCVYAGRRDGVDYTWTMEELGERYTGQMKMLTRMPDALAGTMGNQVLIACFDEQEEVEEFVTEAFAPLSAVKVR